MKKPLASILYAIAAALFASTALAQPAMPQPTDCAKARNPERCEARQKARAACPDKRGADRRQCVKEHMPPPDCSKAPNPARCAAMQAAQEACRGKSGADYRQCVRNAAAGAKP